MERRVIAIARSFHVSLEIVGNYFQRVSHRSEITKFQDGTPTGLYEYLIEGQVTRNFTPLILSLSPFPELLVCSNSTFKVYPLFCCI